MVHVLRRAVPALAATLLVACGSSPAEKKAPARATTTPAPVQHVIHVVYDPPRDQGEKLALEILELGGTSGLAKGFSQVLKLPVDLTIHATHGNDSPFYDPDTKTVTLYYGFVESVDGIIERAEPHITQHELGVQWAAVDGFILVHELGHAFVDVFQLPITGREEDAVDGMATVFLTDFVDMGASYAFDAARFFSFLQKVQGTPDTEQFQDEHSLSVQRAYDIACSVAGSSDATMAQIARLKVLSPERLARCPAEYRQKSTAWERLLKPYLHPAGG